MALSSSHIPILEPLSQEHLAALRKARRSRGGTGQGNPTRKLHQLKLVCALCGRHKHRVRWQLRCAARNKTKVCGGICYACRKACGKLKISRSVKLIKACPGVLQKVLVASNIISKWLRQYGSGDHCACSLCRRGWMTLVRLRGKTARYVDDADS